MCFDDFDCRKYTNSKGLLLNFYMGLLNKYGLFRLISTSTDLNDVQNTVGEVRTVCRRVKRS